MLRIPGNPELEARLLHKSAENLRLRHKALPGYSGLLHKKLGVPEKKLTASEWIRFHVLHRQFSGKKVPGLPLAVSTGRFLIQSLQRLRWNA